MNDKAKQEECKGECFNYESDFQLLTLKEKRGILKNAKNLLLLQRENELLLTKDTLPQVYCMPTDKNE